MKVDLAYGRGYLSVEFPSERTTVIEPAFMPGLPDERAGVLHALNKPVGSAPLIQRIDQHTADCHYFYRYHPGDSE